MSFPRLPPLPAEIEKLFKTTVLSSPMPELNTAQSNQSSELSDEDNFSEVSLPTEEGNSIETDHSNHHSHHHHHFHDPSRSGNMELSSIDEDGLSHTAGGQDFVNITSGREKEEPEHNHDEQGSFKHQLSTANPFRDTATDAEVEKSQRDSTKSLRKQNSETGGNGVGGGGCAVHSSGKEVLAIALFAIFSLA